MQIVVYGVESGGNISLCESGLVVVEVEDISMIKQNLYLNIILNISYAEECIICFK